MFWFPLLMTVTACYACVNNQEHEMFVFPKKGLDYVKVDSSIHHFCAATICFRVKTDRCKESTFFSISTANQADTISVAWDCEHNKFEVVINGEEVHFKGFDFDLNKWHSICLTWDSATGLVQLWVDGCSSPRKFGGGVPFNNPCIILGQEQDTFCGGFEIHECFVGLMMDFNVWSYVLNPCEIEAFMNYKKICSGNAVSWEDLSFHIYGVVLSLEKPHCNKEQFLHKLLTKHSPGSYVEPHSAGAHTL